MFFISIFKKENRRSGKDRRKSKGPDAIGQENRSIQGRRSGEDRRTAVERRTGIYYSLSDNQKGAVDSIIDILEYETLKKK